MGPSITGQGHWKLKRLTEVGLQHVTCSVLWPKGQQRLETTLLQETNSTIDWFFELITSIQVADAASSASYFFPF